MKSDQEIIKELRAELELLRLEFDDIEKSVVRGYEEAYNMLTLERKSNNNLYKSRSNQRYKSKINKRFF